MMAHVDILGLCFLEVYFHAYSFFNVCLYCNGLELCSRQILVSKHVFPQLTTFHIAFVAHVDIISIVIFDSIFIMVRCFFVTDQRGKWETFQDHPVSLYDVA